MDESNTIFSTGIPALDGVLQRILPGDNVVWQVDSIENEYVPFMRRFYENAVKEGKKVVYFRFADHPELIPDNVGVECHRLDPADGFETFISQILSVIDENGEFACYIFDSLSDLSTDWYSDWMLGNFFMLVCPYLFKLKTVAYFGLLRNFHAQHAINDIWDTAQVILDVFKHAETGKLYVHPLKVTHRTSPTMYTLHAWENEETLRPVTKSTIISDLRNLSGHAWLDFTTQQVDVWTRTLVRAKEILDEVSKGYIPTKEKDRIYERLLRMIIARDPRILFLAERYFSLGDLLAIGKRLIGTGLIGGKSVGLLLAHSILKRKSLYWQKRLEPHDSFFIGSDVFYTYIVRNNLWWIRYKIRKSKEFLKDAERVRIKMLEGEFPKNIKNQFRRMLDYFGQSPIIVRSSSLMEDAYKNSFSGKYESIFCPNQGNPEERFQEFLNAVRRVFASTMSEDALSYRQRRNILDRDEQMALLVQRVSGAKYSDFFFPQIAGVGFSYNPYVWDQAIDPKMGMIRLVFGLGTRAVDRTDDDYTRIVSLSAPTKRPESSIDELCKYAQRKVDLLDLKENKRLTKNFEEVANKIEDLPELPLDIFTSQNLHLAEGIGEGCSAEAVPRMLTFDRLLGETTFTKDMLEMLDILQNAYNFPVDVEFTANFLEDGSYRIFPVQCRPFQAKGNIAQVELPLGILPAKTILKTRGPIVGNSIATDVDRIIFVVPDQYSRLSNQDRYGVARLVGRLTHLVEKGPSKVILLLGPGRWATTSPSLGVPVSIGEINTVTIICEIAKMHKDLYPDVSLGTHFFNDLVEMDMLYLAVYPEKKGYFLNEDLLLNAPNHLETLYPEGKSLASVVRVIDSSKDIAIRLNADCITQECICYFSGK